MEGHIQTQNDSSQPLWAPKKNVPKNDLKGIFYCTCFTKFYIKDTLKAYFW